jgi:predicted Zn-dependent protease
LALAGNALDLAEKHAKKLALVAPDDPIVTLIFGYSALRRQDFDQADQRADRLLTALPNDPSAKLLKARILLARGKPDEALRLLEDQLKARPDDFLSLRAMAAMRTRNGQWSEAATAALRIAQLRPDDVQYAVRAIEAAFRAKEFARATAMSEPLLRPDTSPEKISAVLEVWADRWKTPQAVNHIRDFSRRASPNQVMAYATYFNEAGAPEDTAALLEDSPRRPVTAANASVNALIAVAMALRGQLPEAKKVLDAILQIEPDHVYALRGRVNLLIRAGMPRAAVNDAQRLVTITPSSVRDRLLLARAYAAVGDRRQLDRTLWNAFHDIPANHDLYEALRSHVQRTSGAESVHSVNREFQQQLDTQFAREFF